MQSNAISSSNKRKFSRCNKQNEIVAEGLTDDEIQQFKQKGFVLLKDAFPAETAQACRNILWEKLKSKQIDQNNPNTWVKRIGLTDIFMENEGEPWESVLSNRLKRAIDQICGSNQWKEFGCGWWVISFPQIEPSPWGASGAWHIDGAHYQHHVNSQESGLVPIFLFSSIDKTEGGTALCAGSHKVTAQILCDHEPRGLKGKALSRMVHDYVEENDLFEIVEINGKAGDVMLTHPFLLHARSKNLGNKGINSVRFMCNPNVELKCSMRFPRRIEKLKNLHAKIKYKDLSVLETSVLDAITER